MRIYGIGAILCCVLEIAMLFVNCSISEAALFNKSKTGPAILLADVGCYGYNKLQDGFLETFWEVMAEKVQSDKDFNCNLVTPGKEDAKAFKVAHIDAIVRGPLYERENVASEVVRYGDEVFGREYFWNEKKLAIRKEKRGRPYFLGEDQIIALRELAKKYDAEYFLFCNLRNVDTKLKKSIFNVDTNYEERAKEIRVETEYYLIDAKEGRVYEGQNITGKTSQILNIVIGEYGKGASVQQLMQVMFEEQSKRIVEDIKKKGLKTLRNEEISSED